MGRTLRPKATWSNRPLRRLRRHLPMNGEDGPSRATTNIAAGMVESVEVAIVGAGQAGLATSWYLEQAGVEHLVLEAGRVAETWRSRRWGSFRLLPPDWALQLPGAPHPGPAPGGFSGRRPP